MYIPKIKQIVGGKIGGKLLDKVTGRAFGGKFVQDFLGNFYKGEEVTAESESLEFVPDVDPNLVAKELGLTRVYRKPTYKDYQKKTYDRYFIRDIRKNKIVETDPKQYLAEQKEGKLYRRTLKVQWNIVGLAEDTIINDYQHPGLKRKNQDVLNQSQIIFPGIALILNDTTEFILTEGQANAFIQAALAAEKAKLKPFVPYKSKIDIEGALNQLNDLLNPKPKPIPRPITPKVEKEIVVKEKNIERVKKKKTPSPQRRRVNDPKGMISNRRSGGRSGGSNRDREQML